MHILKSLSCHQEKKIPQTCHGNTSCVVLFYFDYIYIYLFIYLYLYEFEYYVYEIDDVPHKN